MIGDGHPVRVAADVVHHLLWSSEGWFSVDDPFQVAHRIQMTLESLRVSQGLQRSEEPQLAGAKASCRYFKNNRRNRRESTRTGRKKCGRQEIHRVPSREIPPPGTTQWRWGWWTKACPQVWSTAKKPISAPRCWGSAAMVDKVSATARNRMS